MTNSVDRRTRETWRMHLRYAGALQQIRAEIREALGITTTDAQWLMELMARFGAGEAVLEQAIREAL